MYFSHSNLVQALARGSRNCRNLQNTSKHKTNDRSGNFLLYIHRPLSSFIPDYLNTC